jgi:hypothetical protein
MLNTEKTDDEMKGVAIALMLAASACSGVVSLPSSVDSSGWATSGAPGASGAAGSNGGGVSGGRGGSLETGPLDPERVVLRRLNRAEYNNTVRDLLGTITKPADNFPGDSVVDGFDTIGAALNFSPLLAEQGERAAGLLVDELLARPRGDPLRTRVLVCEPTAANAATCIPQILTGFMKAAYRRPATTAEVQDLFALATSIEQSSGEIMRGVNAALKTVLLSPHFFFHVELGDPVSAVATPLGEYELASRLSYLVWSSIPDAELTQAADAAKLGQNPAEVRKNLDRMMSDPKAQALVDNFGGQWLSLRDVDGVAPDPMLFPAFDEKLRSSISGETKLFFQSLLEEAQPLTALLLADYTFVNDRLARHYGLPAGQPDYARVSLQGTPRVGLLTQETFLTVTSQPDRTSPVKRGNFVLERLLCDPPDAPPPGVPPLVTPQNGSGLTVRQQLEVHRQSAVCAGCHVKMDPIGLGLENFDAIGAYRTVDNGQPVDATGTMTDGANFRGAAELAPLLAKDPRFASCVVRQLLTYGVGRSFEAKEGKAYANGLAVPLAGTGTWRDLLHTVVSSEAFRTRRGETL